jgi:hypothetical protein
MDASAKEAMETMVRAFRVLKQAKRRGVDVKPYRRRLKEATKLFQAGDYRTMIDRIEQIIAEVTGFSPP